ncbi:AraC family transcriptional regulator [Burkholderia stagnalis]|nr:AraC family transcriptional regulator [Burkholderia stagnalis]RQQ38144.1 AraC family transcriptional regulator [Burkholderia stagnalis]RQQ55720.1 AraC family transcriptional regulator [Burkholderia stagnalis]RQY64535.1 AraC family transcriptional regulator [Burkholderia stagnalis]
MGALARSAGAGSREPGAGSRESGVGSRCRCQCREPVPGEP